MKRVVKFSLSLVTAILTLAAVSATGLPGPTAGSLVAKAVDLPTVQSVQDYLRSMGIDPAKAVFQDGKLNYAGPVCPGTGWNCTDTSQPVVQSAIPGGTNLFDCAVLQTSCVVVQRVSTQQFTASSGLVLSAFAADDPGVNNEAGCNGSDDNSQGENECPNQNFTQSNTHGTNHLKIKTTTKQTRCQVSAAQAVTIKQTNQSGNNKAEVTQKITQSCDGANEGVFNQTQEASQKASISQTTNSGNNAADVIQGQTQRAKANTTATVSQLQNSADNGPNALADVFQRTSGGANNITSNQLIDQLQNASSSAGPITQVQSSPHGGIRGNFDPAAGGSLTTSLSEKQKQVANLAAASQTKYGPIVCCIPPVNVGHTADTASITETVSHEAFIGDVYNPGAHQSNQQVVDVSCRRNCSWTMSYTAQGQNSSNSGGCTSSGGADCSTAGAQFCPDGASSCTKTTGEPGSPAGFSCTGTGGCGVAAAGTGMRNRNHGTIALTGVPLGGSVIKAVLTWTLLYQSTPPAGTITFNGTPITADTGTVSGAVCWGDTNTIGYMKDVTALVAGNGNYSVTNPPVPTRGPDNTASGTLPYEDDAHLVVFFAGGGVNRQVLSDFTYNSNIASGGSTFVGIHRAFAGINSVGGAASLLLAGPDGQNIYGRTFKFTGSSTNTFNDTNFVGSDPQDGPSFSMGNLSDTVSYDASAQLAAGQTTFAFDNINPTTDCIGVGAAVLQVDQTAPHIT